MYNGLWNVTRIRFAFYSYYGKFFHFLKMSDIAVSSIC